MATIYRFIVEQKGVGGGGFGGRKSTEDSGVDKKTPSKKGKWVSLLGSERGGVEHNRKTRAINPLLNKMTGGWWEKGTRLGRAGLGLVQKNQKTGAIRLSPVATAIIIAFVIQLLLKWQAKEREKARQINEQNYKSLENGFSSVRGEYSIAVDLLTAKHTYNQNK